jgi:hypothetical protein
VDASVDSGGAVDASADSAPLDSSTPPNDSGAGTPDASGNHVDSGVTPLDASNGGADAASAADNAGDNGGCGCRTAQPRTSSSLALFAAGALVAAFALRSARRSRARRRR